MDDSFYALLTIRLQGQQQDAFGKTRQRDLLFVNSFFHVQLLKGSGNQSSLEVIDFQAVSAGLALGKGNRRIVPLMMNSPVQWSLRHTDPLRDRLIAG